MRISLPDQHKNRLLLHECKPTWHFLLWEFWPFVDELAILILKKILATFCSKIVQHRIGRRSTCLWSKGPSSVPEVKCCFWYTLNIVNTPLLLIYTHWLLFSLISILVDFYTGWFHICWISETFLSSYFKLCFRGGSRPHSLLPVEPNRPQRRDKSEQTRAEQPNIYQTAESVNLCFC